MQRRDREETNMSEETKILVVDDGVSMPPECIQTSATASNTRTCVKCGKQVKDGDYYHVNTSTTTGPVDVVCKQCVARYAKVMPWKRPQPKVGRNEKCRCGSGKKSKRCCGA